MGEEGLKDTRVERGPIPLSRCSFMLGEGSTQARLCSSADCPGGKPNKGAMTIVPPVLIMVPHNSVSSHTSHASQAADPPLEPRARIYERVRLCLGPLREMCGFSGSFDPPRQPESLLIFTVLFRGNTFSWDWNPGLGRSCVGLGPHIPSGGRLQLLNHHTQVWGPACFASLPLLLVSMWHFLYIL